jgi:uncharacterized protein YqhQ
LADQHQETPPTQATRPFLYGGQAVMEGVMIRGRDFACVAVRRPNGELTSRVSRLSGLYTGPIRRIPFARGVVVLAETLVLGMRSLVYSTNVALEEEGEETELSGLSVALLIATSMAFAIGLFFLLPLFISAVFEQFVESGLLSNIVEGVVRLGVFLLYIWGIGYIPDIRRVFAYHGAEHMTVKAHEAGDPLEIGPIRKYSTAHPRCGTAFLLVVMVLAIFVFALLGRPPLVWLILSRVVLLPVIAALAYEVIRFSGMHQGNPLVRLITEPSLALQALTTRQPEDDQIKVAIHAMNLAMAADEGWELPVDSKPVKSKIKDAPPESDTVQGDQPQT